jgi:hypothetical protein
MSEYLESLSGVTVNLWPIISFEGRNSDVRSLSVLARNTAGQVRRCVLGAFPRDERGYFTECVRKTISKQLATRCVFKIRTSPKIKVKSVRSFVCAGF